jgi:hypothetical protein
MIARNVRTSRSARLDEWLAERARMVDVRRIAGRCSRRSAENHCGSDFRVQRPQKERHLVEHAARVANEVDADRLCVLGLDDRPVLLKHLHDLHPQVRVLDRDGIVHAASCSKGDRSA